MALGMEKVILNAGLDKIAQGVDVEENVEDCVDVLMKFARWSDDARMFHRNRQGSEILQETIEQLDLPKIGLYSSTREKKGKYWIISFYKRGINIEFYFKRGEVNQGKNLFEMAERNELTDEEKATGLLGAVMSDKHHNEVMLGKDARTLEFYEISRVDVLTRKPRQLFGWTLPLNKTIVDTVYKK